jgi:predicted metal-dependent phosphoesterase TrpH
LIDLHTHTTASDGEIEPGALVRQAWVAGLRVLSVTDHDTTAAVSEAIRAARQYGLTLIPGIEITAVDEIDVHVLGYFTDIGSVALQQFLAEQRQARVDRVREIGRRLASFGKAVDTERIIAQACREEQSLGRPAVAAALVAAGHVANAKEAFDVWLGHGRPAAVERRGPTVATVVSVIHQAGGLASLAHPSLYDDDQRLERWVHAGLDAIEAYHSEHDEIDVARYRALAERWQLLLTGGSDYHGDVRRARSRLGHVTLPEADFQRFQSCLSRASVAD